MDFPEAELLPLIRKMSFNCITTIFASLFFVLFVVDKPDCIYDPRKGCPMLILAWPAGIHLFLYANYSTESRLNAILKYEDDAYTRARILVNIERKVKGIASIVFFSTVTSFLIANMMSSKSTSGLVLSYVIMVSLGLHRMKLTFDLMRSKQLSIDFDRIANDLEREKKAFFEKMERHQLRQDDVEGQRSDSHRQDE